MEAVAAIWFFLLEWWSTAGATILSERVGGRAIRQLERMDLHELPDNWVVWTEKVQALRSEEKLRGRPFHAQSTLQEWLDTSQAQRHTTSLPAATTSRGAATSTRPLPTPLVPWRSRNRPNMWRELVPALEASRQLLEQQLTELKTQQRAQQPLSKRLESVRGALQRAQRRAAEARAAFTLAKSDKEQADQEAAKIQSELCALDQEAHNAATVASSTRPLDRCSDIIDRTISELHQAGVPTEQLDQARQAAFTLINGLHGLCSAAGTVTDEAEDQLMEFDGSDEEFMQMLLRAS